MISEGEIILGIISIALLAIGLFTFEKGKRLSKIGKKAKGIVFKNNYKVLGTDTRGTYYPVVRFLTERNEWITQEVDVGTNPPMAEGKEIQVLYDPNNPHDVIINSDLRLIYLPWFFILIGILGLVATCLELLDVTQFM